MKTQIPEDLTITRTDGCEVICADNPTIIYTNLYGVDMELYSWREDHGANIEDPNSNILAIFPASVNGIRYKQVVLYHNETFLVVELRNNDEGGTYGLYIDKFMELVRRFSVNEPLSDESVGHLVIGDDGPYYVCVND